MKKITLLFLLFFLGLPVTLGMTSKVNYASELVTKTTYLPKLMYHENFESQPDLQKGILVLEGENTFGRSKLSNIGANGVQMVSFDEKDIAFEKGKKYDVSYDYKTTQPHPHNFLIIDIKENEQYNIIPNNTPGYMWVTPTTTWQTIQFEFVPRESIATSDLTIHGANSINDTFDIDNITIISNN